MLAYLLLVHSFVFVDWVAFQSSVLAVGVAPRLRLVAVTSSFLDVLTFYHQCLCGEWARWPRSPWH